MKFSVITSDLSAALKVAGRAVNTKATLPVLGNVLIEAKQDDGAGYLSVGATDLEIGLRTRVDAKVEELGAVTLPARLLSNLMATWRQDVVTDAELEERTQTLRLTCGEAKANIKGISADEYPALADPTDWTNVGLDAFELRKALDRVVFAAAADESRPILTGVYIHAEGDELHMAAADGFRLSSVSMKADVEGVKALERGMIVPANALRELARLVPGAGKPVRVCFKPGQLAQVAFVVYDRDGDAETILVSQLIDGNFPDYRQIIPKDIGLYVRADTHPLQTAVQGAQVFASYGVNIVKMRARSGNGNRPDRLVISGSSAEMGEQEAAVDASLDGRMSGVGDEDQANGYIGAIAVNGQYLLDALDAMDESRIEIGMNTPSSPLVLRPDGHDGFVFVLMPMHMS